MKQLITVLIVLAFIWVYKQVYSKFEEAKRQSGESIASVADAPSSASQLPGMPESLEPVLEQAKSQGADGLAQFLRQYGHVLRDPRLADIELDYVVLVSLKDPAEGKRVFKAVQRRVPPSSPVYPRIKKLERTYP